MAPTTIAGPSPSPVSVRQQTTLHGALTSTPNAAVSSSSTQKLIISSISSHTVHVSAATITQKSSTVGLSTTRRSTSSTVSSRSTTRKPATVGLSTLWSTPPNVPSTSTAGSSTTRRTPAFSVYSPGGNHPNYSTILPPISQGQHGAGSGDSNGANTSTIIAGVLVPLILIGVAALAVYIWYRRKYPVRMVLGRDFSRFSNPAYNKRASTLTLVRNDEQKHWDTLCRRNPDLSMVNEDEPDGVENKAFDSETEEEKEIDRNVKVETDIKTSTACDIENRFEEENVQNEGIRRERPKTKKAILVKTSTMEDFENGFELVTESDLGQRTESEVSSGNDSTETHTISLTFSETFDDRHRTDRSSSDMSEVKDTGGSSAENNDIHESECNSLKSASEGTIDESTTLQNDSALDETDVISSKSNESFEVISDKLDTDTKTVQEEQDDTKRSIDASEMSVEELHSENKSEKLLNPEGPEDMGNINEINSVEASNSALPVDDVVRDISESKMNDIEDQESIHIHENKNESTDTDQVEREDGSQESIHLEKSVTEQDPLDELSHDSSFERLSYPEEDKFVNVDQSHQANRIIEESEINVLEKEKTEDLEKDKIPVETNDLQAHSFTEDEEHDTSESINVVAQRKVPSLQLSNENIVLDSDPQSPTLVQESFILENESPLPVYLDSTHMSPRRGRRAFTLNDIVSKPTTDDTATSEFSLPKLNDEKSKSSPVISELKTPNFVFKQFEFESKQDNLNQTDKEHMENTDQEIPETYTNQSEEPNQVDNILELAETNTVKDKIDDQSVTNMSDSNDNFGFNETYSKKDFSVESDDIFKSLDSNSFEFSHNKSEYFDGENNLENSNDDFTDDPFNIMNADSQSGKQESTQQNVNRTEESLDLLNFSDAAGNPFAINNHAQDKAINEVTLDDKASTEDNPFLENFPPSSTPTSSFVVEETSDQNEELKRKKLLPQSFDFGNFDDSDSESSSSSSENSDNLHSPTSARNLIEGIETFSKANTDGDPIAVKAEQQPPDSFASEDLLGLTMSTDSSTALSWEVLSRENSQDSKSTDHLDLSAENKEEKSPERLELSANEDENNESISVTNLGTIDFNFSDMSKQSSTNDTSMGSSATTDISWEIVHEEGDNSEC